MSFPRRTRLVRLAVLGLAVTAVAAPASFAQEDAYSGEGYGGTMDGGAALSDSSAAVAEQVPCASLGRDLITDLDSVALDPWIQAALKNRAYQAAQRQTIAVPQPSLRLPRRGVERLPQRPVDGCVRNVPGMGLGLASLLGASRSPSPIQASPETRGPPKRRRATRPACARAPLAWVSLRPREAESGRSRPAAASIARTRQRETRMTTQARRLALAVTALAAAALGVLTSQTPTRSAERKAGPPASEAGSRGIAYRSL